MSKDQSNFEFVKLIIASIRLQVVGSHQRHVQGHVANRPGLKGYPNIDEMWEIELNNKKSAFKAVETVGSKENWYSKANQYWQKTDSTYDGVLGGYGKLSSLDTNFSLRFLLKLIQERKQFSRGSVLDCGAGIGRISKELLCQVFKEVDVNDQCQKYVEKAKEILKEKSNVRNFYCVGMQDLQFKEKYDCVWIQWVISHLEDKDAVNFLKKARSNLCEGGVIILKENHCRSGFLVDKEDFSVTRSDELFKRLFKEAGLTIIKDEKQENWPQELFQIRMYALA